MTWIVLDGIDATGKSTLCTMIGDALIARGMRTYISSEFSKSFVGAGIQRIIGEQRFYSSTREHQTPFTDLFVILADAVCKYETTDPKKWDAVIMDRGILSALAYQTTRISDQTSLKVSGLHERDLVSTLKSMSRVLTWPDKHINLYVDQPVLNKRLVQRGETALSSQQSDQLLRIQSKMQLLGSEFGAMNFDTTNATLEELRDKLLLEFL